jgi:tryptophan-rich sensory protein
MAGAVPLTKPKSLLALAVFLTIAFATAALGAAAGTGGDDPWYVALEKPPINPPSWVFPVVWTPLYALMGIAAFLVWRAAGERLVPAHALWALQLLLNAAWTWLFFGFRLPWAAFAEIFVLIVAIAAMIFAFARWSRTAAWLMAPYLAWVCFATVLNGWIALLN